MSDFEQFITYRALAFKFETLRNESLTDRLLDSAVSDPQLKNVCAKLSVELSDRIDRTVDHLGVSKRKFIEAALIEALDFADHVLDCVVEDSDWPEVQK